MVIYLFVWIYVLLVWYKVGWRVVIIILGGLGVGCVLEFLFSLFFVFFDFWRKI